MKIVSGCSLIFVTRVAEEANTSSIQDELENDNSYDNSKSNHCKHNACNSSSR